MLEKKQNPPLSNSANAPMLNAYPDSCGPRLTALVELLQRPEFAGVFSYFYILPSLFQTDLDRGFSVQSYELEPELLSRADLESLEKLGIRLKFDFVLNHLSTQSPQFQDLLEKGAESAYRDFFIDWNQFWRGYAKEDENACLIPEPQYLEKLFMRKPGLPVLATPFPDNTFHYYWNTFYQSIELDQEGRKTYLGQMDLNAQSEQVWEFYQDTLERLQSYGAEIIRLDAFAYLHKEIGQSNFFNEPGTWDYLARLKNMADGLGLRLLPEIHASHAELIHRQLAQADYMIYDFFFPGLIIYSLEFHNVLKLQEWLREIQQYEYRTVNMLGSHDGIPLLDLQGLIAEEEISHLISLIQERGGRVKNLYGPDGKKISYYQVNATFFSALGADEAKMLLARAVQVFMPGIPQVWYLDLFGGLNNEEKAEKEGHKEINRSNLSRSEIDLGLEKSLVLKQLALLRFRNKYPAFGPGGRLKIFTPSASSIQLEWTQQSSESYSQARLAADFHTCEFQISYREGAAEQVSQWEEFKF